MQKTIWKYPLTASKKVVHEIPRAAKFLCVQLQGGEPHMWLEVDPNAPKEKRVFVTRGTGHVFEHDPALEYRGTFQIPADGMFNAIKVFSGGEAVPTMVFHVYEDVSFDAAEDV